MYLLCQWSSWDKREFKIEPLNEEGYEDNARVFANIKREMKVFSIAGPIANQCAELLTRVANNESSDEENRRKETKKSFEFWILIDILQV